MINFNRGSGDRPSDPQEVRTAGTPAKPGLRSAVYEPPSQAGQTRGLPPDPAVLRDTGAGAGQSRAEPAPVERHPAPGSANPVPAAQPPTSKLFVGVNIKLKGVEITDCDLLVVEGHVEATVHSKEMQISPPGVLNGTAHIDSAEIHGEFTGELTARSRLVVHGTGKVSGTIRYGKLIVAEGGTISGDMKQIDATEAQSRAAPPRGAGHDSRHSSASSRNAGTT